jgi:hypothetical protein
MIDELKRMQSQCKCVEGQVEDLKSSLKGELVGRKVIVTYKSTKARSRKGVIKAFGYVDGRFMALVYIFYIDSEEIMNTDPWTRSYWPLDKLEFCND